MTVEHIGNDRYPPFRSKGDVLSALERRLIDGEFPVGSRLPSERVLCEQYSISRPVIREVLSGLLERGYIQVYAGRGSFVRAVESSEMSRTMAHQARRGGATARDLVTARLMLESAAAELAAQNADDNALKEITQALRAHDQATTIRSSAQTDLLFHEAIARASNNPLVVLMFGSVRDFVYSLMLRSHSDRRVRDAGDPLHQVILDRITAHDPPKAREAMIEHLRLALDYYGGDLDLPLADVLEERGFDPQSLRALEEGAPTNRKK